MEWIATKNPDFRLRFATPDDAPLVVEYMRKLGTYQKMRDKITATEENMHRIMSEGKGEAVFGEYKGQIEAFAYYCNNSTAFIGETGMYIDGFYVNEEIRGQGLGHIMLAFLSKVAVDRGCGRLEWGCLDWNQSAIDFYAKHGAYCVDIMRIYRFSKENLNKVAADF